MEITRQTDYAIRCVLYLSKHRNDIVMVDEISSEMDIPRSFLAKIIQRLTRGGIVNSFRGKNGGFRLAKNPAEISLLDIINIIQGPIAMNRCAADDAACGFSCGCTVHQVWVELRKSIEEHLSKTDFGAMCSAGSEKCVKE